MHGWFTIPKNRKGSVSMGILDYFMLHDKKAVVTGGQGHGKASAIALAEVGADVAYSISSMLMTPSDRSKNWGERPTV